MNFKFLPFLLCGLLAGCSTTEDFLDYTKTIPETRAVVNKGGIYQGFRIRPDEFWIAMPGKQAPGRAMWGRTNPRSPEHSCVALVAASGRMSREERQQMPIPMLKRLIEKRMEKQNERMKNQQTFISDGRRFDTPSVEYVAEALDTKNPYGKPLKLTIIGFLLITRDGRFFSAQYSERSADLHAEPNRKGAEDFFRRIIPDSPEE